jgi:signal transduction histidine kinase
VAIALGLVYAIVVPSLKQRLVDSRLRSLEHASPGLVREFEQSAVIQDFLDDASAQTNGHVALLSTASPNLQVGSVDYISPVSAPTSETSALERDRVALRALASNARVSGTVTREGERFAEVAIPLPGTHWVLLVSSPLHDAFANVDLVERRLVIAGLIALFFALVIGFGAANVFARRIRRLERAADRIAGGDFSQPVKDAGTDELGELARAFERMRVQLAQLEHARREFVANASHELRTPLFSLGGFLELMSDEELDEPTRREFVATMRDQVNRLTKLAEELLDLTRLDAGRLHVERRRVDLAALAESLVNEFQAVARSEQHPLSSVQNGEVTAIGDEQRVLQIGRILVENAIVHTPHGTTVHIEAGVENGDAVLSVGNDGSPIPPEHREHLFQRFYRIDGTKASGSGLGLAIAQELAELMGGSISLESPSNRTVFRLKLPKSA